MITPTYYTAVLPTGDVCQEYVTLGTAKVQPTLVGVAGSIPMYPGKCDPTYWGKPYKTATDAHGVY